MGKGTGTTDKRYLEAAVRFADLNIFSIEKYSPKLKEAVKNICSIWYDCNESHICTFICIYTGMYA
jgi:hypothetical protein